MSYDVESYIRMSDDSVLTSQKELKQLGFYFSNKPNVSLPLSKTAEKFRARLWFIRHLKKQQSLGKTSYMSTDAF